MFWRKTKPKMSRAEAAALLEGFVNGKGHPHDFDDFTQGMSARDFEDERIDEIRCQLAVLDREYPSDKKGEFCNEAGAEVIRGWIRELRGLGSIESPQATKRVSPARLCWVGSAKKDASRL